MPLISCTAARTAYLSKRSNVVLIVDELNVLLQPRDVEDYAEVGEFLRKEFLDPAGGHLGVRVRQRL